MVKGYFAKNKRCANINGQKVNWIKIGKICIFFVILSLFIFKIQVIKSTFAAEVLDEVVASVNGDIITRQQLNREIVSFGEKEKGSLNSKELQKKVLREIIDEYILKQQAEAQKITVSPGEVQKALKKIQGNLTSQEFTRELKKEKITLEELKKRVKLQLLGEKLLKWKADQLREEIQIRNERIKEFFLSLKSYLQGERKVEKDIIEFYKLYRKKLDNGERVYLAQIVVNSKQEAEKIIHKLKAGEKFSSLAIKFSRALNAKKGGDLGWFNLSQIQSSLRTIIGKMKEGEITPPIKVNDKEYWILQVKKRKELSFEDWEEKIRDYLIKKEVILSLDEWMKKLRENSFIQIMDEDLK